MSTNNSALEFLRDNMTQDENGDFHLTQKKYEEYMSSTGVTKDILSAVDSAQRDLVNAMYAVNAEELIKRVEKDKEEGKSQEDISKNDVLFAVNVPDGSIKLTNTASKTYPIPGQKDQYTTKFMVAKLEINQKRKLDADQCRTYEDQVATLMGFGAKE